MRQKRIILTVNFSPWSLYCGGGQRSTHQLACALSERGHHVTVVFSKAPWEKLAHPADLPYAVRFASFMGIASRRNAPLRPLNAFSVSRIVAALIRDSEETIVHSQGEEGALIPDLKRRRDFRFVVTPRYPDYPKELLAEHSPLWRRAALGVFDSKYLALGRAVRAADAVCPTSHASAEQVLRAFNVHRGKCHIVPNGVAPCFFDVVRRTDAHRGPLLFFGRLAESKGPDTLVEALGLLGPDAPRTVVVGRGDELGRLENRVGSLGLRDRVTFEGWKDPEQIARLLAGASAAVLPSREESFGNAMVETMAAGTPLVSTWVGSIPEVVDESRIGLLVSPDDPPALARAIQTLGDDVPRAEQMGRAGRDRVKQRFSWPATAAVFEEVYNSLHVRSCRCAS